MATELVPLGSTPRVVPKLAREATDLTWPSSRSSTSPTDENNHTPAPPDHVSIIHHPHRTTKYLRRSKNAGYRLVRQQQIKNSLLAGVGFLELANAGDFAANVWNQIPVPRHAVILMAIGGPIALSMVFFAVRDFVLSRRNVQLLKAERGELLALRDSTIATRGNTKGSGSEAEDLDELARALDSRLGVGIRELGTEIVDRMVMDVLMGIGALMVGVGTIMAIFGAHPRVFHASNLLSGYVGNSMAAAFGLFNSVWSAFLIYRFQVHDIACCHRKTLTEDQFGYTLSTKQKARLHVRFRLFQWHAIVNALNGLVAGAASMVTATRWWGYVVLIPCIISLILCNYFWRYKLGYDRPIITMSSFGPNKYMHHLPLLTDLEYVSAIHDALAESGTLPSSIVDLDSLEGVISFIARNHMFESFCEWLLSDDQSIFDLLVRDHNAHPHPHTQAVTDARGHTHYVLSPSQFLHVRDDDELSAKVLERGRSFIQNFGRKVFAYRERYLLELVGYAVWRDQAVRPTSGGV